MKTILITGSTDGIGKLAAEKLAKEGHEILLHGRNLQKLENTISELKASSNNENIRGYVGDLSDFQSIENMINELNETTAKIDVLINNAGVFKSSIQTNKGGLDLRFMVNYLAPFLLTHGIFPLLKNSDSPRLINLSSAAQSSVDLEALKGDVLPSNQMTYAQSKLALTMWSFTFAKTHPKVTTIAVNPGSLLNTNMVKEAYGYHWSSADKGANILYEIALSDEHSDRSGMYFDNDKGSYSEAHPDAYEPAKINELINTTQQILKG